MKYDCTILKIPIFKTKLHFQDNRTSQEPMNSNQTRSINMFADIRQTYFDYQIFLPTFQRMGRWDIDI